MEVPYYILLLIVQIGVWQFDRKIMATEKSKGKNDLKLILMAMSGIFLFIIMLSIWHHRIEKVKKIWSVKCATVNKSFQKVKNQCWQRAEWGCDEQHTQNINPHPRNVAVTRLETRQIPGLSANTKNYPTSPLCTNLNDYYLFTN